MIPGQHPVVETDDDVVEREVVVARRRQPLERQAPVVADVAGRTALKRRQAVDRLGAMRREQLRASRERERRSVAGRLASLARGRASRCVDPGSE